MIKGRGGRGSCGKGRLYNSKGYKINKKRTGVTKMKQVRVKGYLRKVKGRGAKVRVRGHLRKK